MNYGLLVLILFPIIAGIISYITGKKSEQNRNDWVDIAMFVQLILLICMIVEMVKGWELKFVADVVFGLGFSIVLDPVRLLLCGVIFMICFAISQYMKASLKKEANMNGFYLLFLWLQGFFYGVVMSDTIFGFCLFMIPAYIILLPMMLQRQDDTILKNIRTYPVMAAISFGLVLVGLLLLFSQYQFSSFNYLFLFGSQNYNVLVALAGILLIIGFGIWAGMFPLHQLVTRSCSIGLMEVSAIAGLILSKLGVWGLVLTMRAVFYENRTISKIVLVWLLIAIIFGLCYSLLSTDIRKILVGINVTTNGMIGLGGAVALLDAKSGAYPLRSVLYIFVSTSIALVILYMIALEFVRKARTYEIKGLISVGKGQKMLVLVAFLACATLIGVPGTLGFLGQSLLLKSMLTIAKWKWLVGVYVIQWAFYMTAIARLFMKLFISKKDETMHVMVSEEELEANQQKKEPSDPKNAYWFGQLLLGIYAVITVVAGIIPRFTVDRLSEQIENYFQIMSTDGTIPYFTMDVCIIFVISAILAFVIYLNLVHGIILRAVKNKKNKKIQEEFESEA